MGGEGHGLSVEHVDDGFRHLVYSRFTLPIVTQYASTLRPRLPSTATKHDPVNLKTRLELELIQHLLEGTRPAVRMFSKLNKVLFWIL